MRRILLSLALLAVGSLVATGVALAGKTAVPASPSHLNFGKVPIGAPSTLEVQFTNNTAFGINLSTVTYAGKDTADFSILDESCASWTEIGGACSLFVKFIPSHAGRESAKITFTWSTAEDSTTVSVAGSGVSP